MFLMGIYRYITSIINTNTLATYNIFVINNSVNVRRLNLHFKRTTYTFAYYK